MEMSQISFNSIENKGLKGEEYVAKKITKLSYKVLYVGGAQLYSITGSKFYTVDLALFGKGKTFWAQVKYKEPRRYYPDTGMELWRYRRLIKHQEESGLKVLVLFTDNSGKIYGEWLDNLPNCISPHTGKNKQGETMIYWLLEKLKDYRNLI